MEGLVPDFLPTLSLRTSERSNGDWISLAHPHQMPPDAAQSGVPWTTWLLLGGRGAGKTRAGAEWVRALIHGVSPFADAPMSPIALVGETEHEVREVMIEGVSGLLAVSPRSQRPTWPIDPARAEGIPYDSRIVASAERQAAVSTTTGGTIVTGGVLAWLSRKFDAVQQMLEPLTPYAKPFANLFFEYWWAFLGAGLAYVVIEQAHVRKARIVDHRDGKTT